MSAYWPLLLGLRCPCRGGAFKSRVCHHASRSGLGTAGWGLSLVLWMATLGCGSRSGLDWNSIGGDAEDEALALEPRAPMEDPEPRSERSVPIELVQSEQQDTSGCVSLSRYYPSEPASVLLLVDQSGSMELPFRGRRRWDVLRDAVVDSEVGLLARLELETRVGVMFYSSLNGFEGGSCPLVSSIQPAQGSRASIAVMYSLTEPLPDGDTPTAEALLAAGRMLNGSAQAGPKYIVLITDGLPDTCGEPDPQRGLGAALEAARSVFRSGVRVLTVGVSQQLARQPLQWMANAGAGKPIELVYGRDPDAEPPLTASSDSARLARQLRGAIGDVRSCLVSLGTDVERARAGSGELLLDGELLAYDTADGWTLADSSTVEIHGAACERIQTTGERLEVRFPCPER